MKLIAATLVFLTVSSVCANAQDSTQKPTVTFDLSAIHLYQLGEHYGAILNSDAVPDYIGAVPGGHGPFGPVRYSYATDAPTFHGAQSFDLSAVAAYRPNILFRGSLIAEHRGSSYGVYNTTNIIVYPRFHFLFDTSFQLFNEQFSLHNEIGNFVNYRSVNGLLLYNIDGSGTRSSIGWRALHFNYTRLGDALAGIGLNTDDAVDFTLSLDDVHINSVATVSLHAGVFNYNNYWHKELWSVRIFDTVIRGDSVTRFESHSTPVPFVMGNTGWTLAAGIRSDSLRGYTEYRYRNALQDVGSLHSSSALLVGISNEWNEHPLRVRACAEYRFYGSLFNENYINQDVRYRRIPSAEYAETVGPYVYPLTQFLRPFSQWAVFTEYQGRDVVGLNLLADLNYTFYDDFALNVSLDLNRIKAGSLAPIYYPFYNAGISWEPAKNTGLFAWVSNRAMNLDKHYPTFYLLASPAVQLQARFNFDPLKY